MEALGPAAAGATMLSSRRANGGDGARGPAAGKQTLASLSICA